MTNSPRLIAANNRASSAESGLSAGALVLPPDGTAQGFRDFGQGGRFIHVGQPVQIALVGGLAELGSAMGVGHAFAQVSARLCRRERPPPWGETLSCPGGD